MRSQEEMSEARSLDQKAEEEEFSTGVDEPGVEDVSSSEEISFFSGRRMLQTLFVVLLLSEAGPVEGAVGWGYALTLGFALVYLGEHYVTDLVAGALLVAAVRRGEPLVEPMVLGVNRALQRLERVAGS